MTAFGGMRPLGLGLVGLVGAGVIGYALLNKKRSISTTGFSSTGKLSTWRKFLPFRSSVMGTTTTFGTAPISTGFANGGLVNNIAKAPIVHNRKVPMKERLISKVSGRPVVTNYH